MRRYGILTALLLAACAVPPPQASPPAPPGVADATLLQLESDWREAYRLSDVASVARIEDEGFVRSGEAGANSSRADDLGELAAHTVEYSRYENREVAVQVGGGGATVTGICLVEGMAGDAPFRRELRFTDRFGWRDGAWRALSEQLVPLGPPG